MILVEPFESPRDANGKLLSVPIKLEMETREDQSPDRTTELMSLYRREFMTVSRKLGIDIVPDEEMQTISDGGLSILPFQMICENWQSTLARFVRQFFMGVQRYRISSQEKPVISTHSTLLYPLRLVNHNNIPLARIQFGSLINNGRLGIHWSMDGEFKPDDRALGFTFHKGIYAYFEYDRRDISITYTAPDPHDLVKNKDLKGKISFDMSSIQRIFFDHALKGSAREISLVLLLECPPKLQMQRRNNAGSSAHQDTHEYSWEYRSQLQRGEYPDERSDKEALHDSKAVILQFDLNVLEEKLMDGSSSIDAFLHDVASRLRHKTGKKIEYSSMKQELLLEGELRQFRMDNRGRKIHPVCPYYYDDKYYNGGRTDFDEVVCGYIGDAAEKLVLKDRGIDGPSRDYHKRWKAFRIQALLQGILDRGMEFRIELLCDDEYTGEIWYAFVKYTSDQYAKDEARTLFALERVMTVISDRRPNCSIPELFQKEWDASTPTRLKALFNEQDAKDGYWKIMKFVVTPTRIILVGYEVIMGNRVLNKYAKNENHIIRVNFRDDRGGQIWASSYPPEVQARIRNILINGLYYAGRTYAWLGHSNSQLREQGIYMMHIDHSDRNCEKPQEIRSRMGDFYQLPNIPKMLARLGQVFTQSKPSEMVLSASEVGVTFDLVGGRNSAGKPYIFSDGVGLISEAYAKALSKEHRLQSTASAFQIRYRGEKGLLCVDPSIDERNELLRSMGLGAEEKKVFVRHSMIKFEVLEEEGSKLEIVKSSYSSVAFLNRPFINILCQVSEKQSAQCHRRVKGRVKELLYSQLKESIQSLYIERKAIETIREMAFPFSMEVFTPSSGLTLTNEPFFHALLRSGIKYVIQKQLSKMSIRIPTANARTMFGVVDYTGILQYGQVFCQYSGSLSKHGQRHGESVGDQRGIVHTGPTMITKNPCHSSGDVRMFEAVDVIRLRHLVDVVVFPMHGPRPHPDEMAGSDLDGDEYMVIWDEQLLLEKSEEAAIFPIDEDRQKWAIPRTSDGRIDMHRCEERKADFYTEAIVHGNPGMLCTAHLAVSDLYGLDSKPSKTLATKISQTLDYQKSGVQPERITVEEGVEDPDDPTRVIPPEKSQWKPDFLRAYRDPGYESRGILGEVFREVNKYESSLECSEGRTEKIEIDPSFHVAEWTRYKSSVERELGIYTESMKSVIEHYGIATEEEMMSGMILSVKNRLSDKEEEDGSFFTTNRVIEERVKRIQENAREKFFENLLDWKTDLDEVESKMNDVKPDSILNRRVKSNTKNMDKIRRKAAAAYYVAYETANRNVEKGEQCIIILSFPWLFYDVLIDIKTRPDKSVQGVEEEKEEREQSNEPLAVHLSEAIDRYSEDPSNLEKFANFMNTFDSDDSIVGLSLKENEGLAKAAFLLVEWANYVGGLSRRFGEEHLVSLFILFGLGEIQGQKRKYIQKPLGDIRIHSKKGAHLLSFIDFVSSWEFRVQSTISFSCIGGGVLMRGEWKAFSEMSLASFLSLVINHRLDLPMEGGNVMAPAVKEYEPRVMYLPETYESERVREALLKVSGCTSIKLRPINSQLVTVSALGTSEQLRVLSSFIYPPAPSRETATLKGQIESMGEFTYDRLMKAAIALPSRKH